MNALARYIQRFDTGEVAPPVDLMLGTPDSIVIELPVDKMAEAEAEGRRLGRADAERAFEERLGAERAAFAQSLVEERARWSAEEGGRLAEALTGATRQLAETLSEAASRTLLPFVATGARERAIVDLGATLETLLSDGRHPVVTVSGPCDLLDALAARLGPRGSGVTFDPVDRPDVRVVADATIIETQLAAWLGRLADSQG